jgi:cobalt-precorrin-5B (C1)-methyltransferase
VTNTPPKRRRKQTKLRSGFTTGASAAAAAKGALMALCGGGTPQAVEISFLNGEKRGVDLHRLERISADEAVCTVIKDAGDDPDVTHKAEIGVRLRLDRDTPGHRVTITGGEGVGVVTKPGLGMAVGAAAINPGPRKMMCNSIAEVFEIFPPARPVAVEVFIPKGVELAQKTLNARLGILGGLSVLGTTGIVRPLSHGAWVKTIEKALSVARHAGLAEVVLTTGRRSERFAQKLLGHLPEEGFVQIGDFFQKGLRLTAEAGFKKVTLTVFFGKAVKQARGIPHTHAAKARQTLVELARWTLEETGDADLSTAVENANTARHAFDILLPHHPAVIQRVGREMLTQAQGFANSSLDGSPLQNRAGKAPSILPSANLQVCAIILDYQGQPLYQSEKAGKTNL